MATGNGAADELRHSKDQWQEQPPPQQPPPPEKPPDEAEEPAVENTESWIVAFLLEHLGQLISCCLLITIFSKRSLQLSQTYS
jgi:hypothetical protein